MISLSTSLLVTALSLLAISFGLWALAICTRPGRHHDHLLPLTPRRYRPAN